MCLRFILIAYVSFSCIKMRWPQSYLSLLYTKYPTALGIEYWLILLLILIYMEGHIVVKALFGEEFIRLLQCFKLPILML